MNAYMLAQVTKMANDVFGSIDAAEHWLVSPAVALDRRRPIDLLDDPEGTKAVTALLVRMDYCVYA